MKEIRKKMLNFWGKGTSREALKNYLILSELKWIYRLTLSPTREHRSGSHGALTTATNDEYDKYV